jgi:hypothetical protein
MSIAVPSAHASYPFRASMLLSQSRESVRQWGVYKLHASLMENGECLLTIGVQEQAPHINEVFEDGEGCLDYLRGNDLPTSGWCPVELVREPQLTF